MHRFVRILFKYCINKSRLSRLVLIRTNGISFSPTIQLTWSIARQYSCIWWFFHDSIVQRMLYVHLLFFLLGCSRSFRCKDSSLSLRSTRHFVLQPLLNFFKLRRVTNNCLVNVFLIVWFRLNTGGLSVSTSAVLRISLIQNWWICRKFKVGSWDFCVLVFWKGEYILISLSFRGVKVSFSIKLFLLKRWISTALVWFERESVSLIDSWIIKFAFNFLFVSLHLHFELHVNHLFTLGFVFKSFIFIRVDWKGKLFFLFTIHIEHGFLLMKLLLLFSK